MAKARKAVDNTKYKHGIRAVILLLVFNLLLSGGIIGYLASKNIREAEPETGLLTVSMDSGTKYLLYIGTNDKDTYQQEIPTEEAKEIVNSICTRYTGGYTASDAKGGWVDETDTLTQENTLVYAFYDVTEDQLICIMNDVLRELNQNSILVEKQYAVYTYYSGQ